LKRSAAPAGRRALARAALWPEGRRRAFCSYCRSPRFPVAAAVFSPRPRYLAKNMPDYGAKSKAGRSWCAEPRRQACNLQFYPYKMPFGLL